MRSLTRPEWLFLAAVYVVSFIPTFGGLIRIAELGGALSVAPPNQRAILTPTPIILHILGSFVFCLFGALQLLPSLRQRNRPLHRAMGRVVALAGIVAALTGLWMTQVFDFPDSLQGPLLYGTRLFVGMMMAILIVHAVLAVRAGDIAAHRAAMIRAYAIGQGAATQTVFGLTWIIVMGAEAAGPTRDVLMVSAWVFNAGLAEWAIRRMSRPRGLRVTG